MWSELLKIDRFVKEIEEYWEVCEGNSWKLTGLGKECLKTDRFVEGMAEDWVVSIKSY